MTTQRQQGGAVACGPKGLCRDRSTPRGRSSLSYEDTGDTVLDAATAIHTKTLGLSHPVGIASMNSEGLYSDRDRQGQVDRHITKRRTRRTRAGNGAMPDAVAVDETANRIYVTNYVGDSVRSSRRNVKRVPTVAAGSSSTGACGGWQRIAFSLPTRPQQRQCAPTAHETAPLATLQTGRIPTKSRLIPQRRLPWHPPPAPPPYVANTVRAVQSSKRASSLML